MLAIDDLVLTGDYWGGGGPVGRAEGARASAQGEERSRL